jgi:hypothetical protein
MRETYDVAFARLKAAAPQGLPPAAAHDPVTRFTGLFLFLGQDFPVQQVVDVAACRHILKVI